jgi:hypothetical protein
MDWLSPLTAFYAAAAVLPLFVLLYFLKLKRREQIISSTLLWKRAVQDLQVNAPFQRIRRNILFFLQLLAFLLMLIAVAWPVIKLSAGPAKRYVLLLDCSAGMNATDTAPSRLDDAKKQAKTFIESLRDRSFFSLTDTGDQAMVIAFSGRPRVMCSFTSNKSQIISAIDSITPTDGRTLMAEAVTVARAFAQSSGADENNSSSQTPAKLLLFSDGQIADIDQISISSDELTFYSIGQSSENIAITALRARRSYENPELVDIFATVANFGDQPVSSDVQLGLNGNVQTVKTVTIPPQTKNGDSGHFIPGNASIDFTLSFQQGGIIELKQLHKDLLACDDTAWVILPPPKKINVLLVTAGNAVLESALRSCPIAGLKVATPAEFRQMDQAALSIQQTYDCVVLDCNVPANLGKGRYLTFGIIPPRIDVNDGGPLTNQVIVDWRSKHPALNYVHLANLFVANCKKLILPRDAEILAEFTDSPAIAVVRRAGSTYLMVGFDVLESNWPFEPGFVLFCYNALAYLSSESSTGLQTELQPAQPIIVDGLTAGTKAKITCPAFANLPVESTPSGTIRFPDTEKTGLYSIRIPGQPDKTFAVNLLDAKESDITPLKEIKFSGQAVASQSSAVHRANFPLWPFLVAAVLLLVFVEWLIYNLKVRI